MVNQMRYMVQRNITEASLPEEDKHKDVNGWIDTRWVDNFEPPEDQTMSEMEVAIAALAEARRTFSNEFYPDLEYRLIIIL
jgi:hypothetical protein